MNLYAYGYGTARARGWMLVDCGIGFGHADSTPGVETILPDPRFLAEPENTIDAIFLTHAHEDHIGAMVELWPRLGRPPIVATSFAAAVLRGRFAEASLEPGDALQVVAAGERVEAGAFRVVFHAAVHSIPDAHLLEIRTPLGVLVHSGDFRVAPPPGSDTERALRTLGDAGVLCMACESTNIFEPGSARDEEDLRARIEALIGAAPGLVAATTFSSNIRRMITLAQAAAACGRSVFVVGRAMQRMLGAARDTGFAEGLPPIATEPDRVPRRDRFYLLTGSQGEGRAALARIAANTHPSLALEKDDLVLYASSTVPGNERAVHRVQNALARRGVRIVEGETAGIHLSGHAGYGEIERLYRLVRPQRAIPIHGEPRHLLEHAARAREWGVADVALVQNGQEVRIAPDGLAETGSLDCGLLYREARLLLPAGRGVIRDRRRMSEAGHVSVALLLDRAGRLRAGPGIATRGAPLTDPAWPDSLEEGIAAAVADALVGLSRRERGDRAMIETCATQAVQRLARRRWGRRPAISVLMLDAE